MVFLSALCIGGFYATSLTWGRTTHLLLDDRVLALVAGAPVGRGLLFEVFATAVIALLFHPSRPDLRRGREHRDRPETIVFPFGGIPGTLHHLYFTGTPTSVIAIGAMFSALEAVPLAMIGVEAYRNYQRLEGGRMGGAYSGRSSVSSPSASERRRRRPARLLDQHADRALLHAGYEHDRCPRPRCAVRVAACPASA